MEEVKHGLVLYQVPPAQASNRVGARFGGAVELRPHPRVKRVQDADFPVFQRAGDLSVGLPFGAVVFIPLLIIGALI